MTQTDWKMKINLNINLNLHVFGSEISLIEQNALVSSLEVFSERTFVLVDIFEKLFISMIRWLDVIYRDYEQIIPVQSSLSIRQITLFQC